MIFPRARRLLSLKGFQFKFSRELSSVGEREGAGGQKFGQPTEWSHPHLIGKGEVNHGISRDEFKIRRDNLIEKLLESSSQERPHNLQDQRHLLIIPSAKRQFMVDKIPYNYRQDTDFRYLTGCTQFDTVLVIEFTRTCSKSVLFCKEPSPYDEKWEGARIGFGEAVTWLGMDEAAPLSSLESYLYQFIKSNLKVDVWYDYLSPRNSDTHRKLGDFVMEARIRGSMEEPRSAIHQLRSIKSPAEIQLMRKTCQIGAEALRLGISSSRRLHTEDELLNTIEHQARMSGACMPAYPSVVAAGEAACVIHYTNASAALRPSDMVLVDAGCEFQGYSSDISRTWPLGGSFTHAQGQVYQAVQDVQQQLIAGIQPGVTSIDSLYRQMMPLLGSNLQALGLVAREEKLLQSATHQFCPHHVAHYLGMDVHDTPSVSKTCPLQPGMVITVEPGCYIPTTMAKVAPEFLGLGVRIEDDILITESGAEVLSQGCPRDMQALEDLVNSL